jgi:FtsP/CotA-like multicopper oxidase with cupredoxin domain
MHVMPRAGKPGHALRGVITLWLCATVGPITASGRLSQVVGPARETPERITISDNRVASGILAGRTLTIHLEARTGEWYPDRDTDPGVVVKAFAVEGGPLQIPGPLIRVTEGTEIRVFIRNRLGGDPLAIHGLYTRVGKASASTDVLMIPPGESREFAFVAGSPGTYYYWGATDPATVLGRRTSSDSQLSGALIVDPRGSPPDPDRVLLIGLLGDAQPINGTLRRIVINGRSWPHTERLTYRVGDSVRMRVINAGAAVHPMHLHGFYFNVDSRGDEREDTIFPPDSSPHLVVTERLASGRTFTLTWKPTRPGNWLFHCHDNSHLLPGGSLDGKPPLTSAASHHVQNHALEMMAGPVMGITVTGVSAERAASTSDKRRRLRLVARVDSGGTDDEPAFGYTLENDETPTPPPTPYLPGPTIVLKRGEPVSITVANQLPEPTAVHWHGIELESYYDGVAGFAGEGKRIAPPIPPGGSFEARFTPPRSGTFIYHTHIDEVRQQQAGLSGALLVVDSPETYEPEHDLVLLVTVPRKNPGADVVLLNGSSTPPAREMRVGQHYRLRFINVHTFRPSMRMRLLRESALLRWRALAKDGMELPDDQRIEGSSEIQMGNGETYDFDFIPSGAGDIHLDVTNAAGSLLVSMPIRIR